MAQTTVPARLDTLQDAANDTSPSEEQAKLDVEHASTGWSAYEVWRTRILGPKKGGHDDPHGNS